MVTLMKDATQRRVLARFPCLGDVSRAPLAPLPGGLINATWRVGADYVLQRLSPIFAPEVNLDIAALTPTLRDAGVAVPDIALADDGRPWVEDEGVWRVLTWLEGHTLHGLASPAQARSAAALVARFHSALRGVTHRFHFARPGAHDTAAHMAALRDALPLHRSHRLAAPLAPVAAEILARWDAFEPGPSVPQRIVHGDLKISNLRFDDDGEAVGLLDLDTMGWLGLDVELGDALRSWCNPAGEDAPEPVFDHEVYAAAVRGYLSRARRWLTEAEAAAIAPGVERIALELAARFARDALEETYFGFDPTVAATRGEHNLLRARNQLGLARLVADRRPALVAGVLALW
jgi:Ser/Thr protein kinase RdoA (MazF antagonist)